MGKLSKLYPEPEDSLSQLRSLQTGNCKVPVRVSDNIVWLGSQSGKPQILSRQSFFAAAKMLCRNPVPKIYPPAKKLPMHRLWGAAEFHWTVRFFVRICVTTDQS